MQSIISLMQNTSFLTMHHFSLTLSVSPPFLFVSSNHISIFQMYLIHYTISTMKTRLKEQFLMMPVCFPSISLTLTFHWSFIDLITVSPIYFSNRTVCWQSKCPLCRNSLRSPRTRRVWPNSRCDCVQKKDQCVSVLS